MPHTFALLMPVKTLALAKSRLEVPRPDQREPLMRAFALDAIAAASRSTSVAQVYVVTDEPGFEINGAVRLPDEGEGDLNRALHHAWLRVRLLDPAAGVAAMCADLPCLTTEDLDAGLAAGLDAALTVGPAAGLAPRWFVADASGEGTTFLAARPGADLDPHFGVASARRHEESGARPVSAAVPTLRMDVDTETDLVTARGIGLGPQTTRALAVDPTTG